MRRVAERRLQSVCQTERGIVGVREARRIGAERRSAQAGTARFRRRFAVRASGGARDCRDDRRCQGSDRRARGIIPGRPNMAAQNDGDEHVVSQARRSGHRLAHAIGSNVTCSYLRTLMLELGRPVGVICLQRDRQQRGRASQERGVIPVASSPRIWKPRALGGRRGASALEATIALRHDDASPHKGGGGREHGHRCWKRPENEEAWP
jgi:hypothetical protein